MNIKSQDEIFYEEVSQHLNGLDTNTNYIRLSRPDKIIYLNNLKNYVLTYKKENVQVNMEDKNKEITKESAKVKVLTNPYQSVDKKAA